MAVFNPFALSLKDPAVFVYTDYIDDCIYKLKQKFKQYVHTDLFERITLSVTP